MKGVVSILNAVFTHSSFSDMLRYDFEKLMGEEVGEVEDTVVMEED